LGPLLLALAFIIFILSIIEIVSNEIILSNPNLYGLSVEEVWSYEGALLWWNRVFTSIIVPTTIILTISGITVIIYPKISYKNKKINIKNLQLNNKKRKVAKGEIQLMKKANNIMKTLSMKENILKKEKKKLASLREKWQNKIEEDIRTKENNIQKLIIEINDLKYIQVELNKNPQLFQ
jgi:hypothetical protein